MFAGILLLAAFQVGGKEPVRVPVEVVLVERIGQHAVPVLVVRNPDGRDMILVTPMATSNDLGAAVERFKDIYHRNSSAVSRREEYSVKRITKPLEPSAVSKSVVKRLRATRLQFVAGVGEGRVVRIFVTVEQEYRRDRT
ncbi:MAG: hypothetical protein ACRENP_22065 [Longimicrobiales bacterium]